MADWDAELFVSATATATATAIRVSSPAARRDGRRGSASIALLALSVRTLRRRLAEEDTSFRMIVSETKVRLAQELQETDQLTVDQVADRLGYCEASSFVHALRARAGCRRRWTRRSA